MPLAPSDRGGAHLEGASHLPEGVDEVGLMETEEDRAVPLEECIVEALMLDDVHDMYSAVEDFYERLALNKRNAGASEVYH